MSYGGIVSDCHIFGVQLVDVNKLCDPNVLSDMHASQAMEPWSKRASTWDNEGDFMDYPCEDASKHPNTPQKPRFTAK